MQIPIPDPFPSTKHGVSSRTVLTSCARSLARKDRGHGPGRRWYFSKGFSLKVSISGIAFASPPLSCILFLAMMPNLTRLRTSVHCATRAELNLHYISEPDRLSMVPLPSERS
ncbi:uncharacterized protein SCHCODRAFT_02285445 [Schizophyllum commune H4-8]|uniref:uncharacterized protein n=1 Tax=Schizophyllum commune (strain H4-8 / FGSC 9210) TaxID=578458 RepID=UPI0021607E03|nr:uncharacterized protein SCHCODRAFT_02285445 [Schizophyllum commune H4-8]KAI5892173.1 hypothetical protein SCHCODRAFT_02285445 [Schizophyllum commune H4-8]